MYVIATTPKDSIFKCLLSINYCELYYFLHRFNIQIHCQIKKFDIHQLGQSEYLFGILIFFCRSISTYRVKTDAIS